MTDRIRDDWRRVSRAQPCPVCGHPDWCLVSADGTAAICPRVESNRRAGDAGYLHRLVNRPFTCERRTVRVPLRSIPTDLGQLADRCVRECGPARLADLARSLGVSAESLTALAVGWYVPGAAWSWPMTDPKTGRVVGIRLRRPDGTKFAVKGGRDGLFLPCGSTHEDHVLLVAEGPTDTAAALTLGYAHVVGRPSCTGGTHQLAALVRARRPGIVAVLADNDGPGRDGARRLARSLRLHARDVRVVTPPPGVKDLRAWLQVGVTRADVDRLVAAATPQALAVRIAFGGGSK